MTKVDLFLISGLVAATAALASVELGLEKSPSGQEKISSWDRQEQVVVEKLKAAASIDPKTFKQRLEQEPALRRKVILFTLGMTFLNFGVIWALARLVVRLFRREPVLKSLGSPPAPVWGLGEILRVVGALFLLTELALLSGGFLRSIFPGIPWDPHVASLMNTLLIDVAAVAAALTLFRSARPLICRFLGPQTLAQVRLGAMGYLTFLPLFVVLALAAAWVAERLGRPPTPQAIFTIFLSESRAPVLWGLVVLVTLAGPVAEEFFFRGLVYGWLRSRLGIGKALLATALLFAGLHADPVAFLPIAGLGLLFGWLYEKTGTLAAPIAIHTVHNTGMLYLAHLAKSLLGPA